jgi:hypothetical protein
MELYVLSGAAVMNDGYCGFYHTVEEAQDLFDLADVKRNRLVYQIGGFRLPEALKTGISRIS